ncbi:MAG TPA: plastocyanin/azurin family copper-binding protein [Thermoleophilaceae bacterium]|nr:plastocyanin/azurin family copper-binding protein [Thermoleophilaceae bacterium]
MTKFLAPLCACLALALVTAGCGGGDDNGGGGGGGGGAKSEQKQPAGGGGGTTAKSASVAMKNIQFNPKSVTVSKGGSVKWTNDDSVGHDVTGSDFKSGSAGGLSGGDTFSHTFNKAGTYKYRCTVHPGMEGTVTVK